MEQINLFCLPFAGASKYSYTGFAKQFSPVINVIPIDLPGRGTRFKEDLLIDSAGMAKDIYNQIKGQLHSPYAIYGHSMGTLLGYLVTQMIIENGMPQPLHLFFTGCGGPSLPRLKDGETARYLLPKKDFIFKLKEYGGSPDEILEDDTLMDFFEPILRADFQSIETYVHKENPLFNIPVFVAIGSEENVTEAEAMTWQNETAHKVELKIFQGKHFFIFDHERELAESIEENLIKIKAYG